MSPLWVHWQQSSSKKCSSTCEWAFTMLQLSLIHKGVDESLPLHNKKVITYSVFTVALSFRLSSLSLVYVSVSLCGSDFLSSAGCRLMLLVFFNLLLILSLSLSLSSFFDCFLFFLASNCFQEPYGVIPVLSVRLSVHGLVFLCVFWFLSCLAALAEFIEISVGAILSLLYLWRNVIFCCLLFVSSQPQSRSKMLAFTLPLLCNCVTSLFRLHKCNYLFSVYEI